MTQNQILKRYQQLGSDPCHISRFLYLSSWTWEPQFSSVTQSCRTICDPMDPREFDFGGQWDLITGCLRDWGNRLLEGTNQTLCTPGPRRKEQWLHNRLSQTCLWASRSLQQRHGSKVACRSPFEGNYCNHPYHSLASGKTTGRGHSHNPKENWIKDLLSMALPNRTRPRFPFSQSLPSGSFHKPLFLIHQTTDRIKTTVTEN